MAFNFLRNILALASKRRSAKWSGGCANFRPRLEPLEERLLLATRVWDGGAGSNDLNWTNRINWQSDIAPVAGNDLVFDDATRLSSINDFPHNTMFNSITITTDVSMFGHRITLGPGGLVAQSFDLNDSVINVGINLTFTSSSGAVNVLNSKGVDTTLQLVGSALDSRLTKTGPGTLSLRTIGTNLGGTVVQAGILRVEDGMTIGTDEGGGTTVANGAVLELDVHASEFVTGGTLALNGGTLRHVAFGSSTCIGRVVLGAASTITSSSGAGTFHLNQNVDNGGFVLTIDGTCKVKFGGDGVLSGAGGLTRNGTGTLTMRGAGINTYSGRTIVNAGVLRLEKPSGLGAVGGFSTATSTAAGAILELAGEFTVTEGLNFSGTTFPVRSHGGTNTWTDNIFLSATTTTFIADTDPLRLTGVISGQSGTGLTKLGPSRLELSGNNTYNGPTTVIEGTLTINRQQPSSRVVVSSTGTLEAWAPWRGSIQPEDGSARAAGISARSPPRGMSPSTPPHALRPRSSPSSMFPPTGSRSLAR